MPASTALVRSAYVSGTVRSATTASCVTSNAPPMHAASRSIACVAAGNLRMRSSTRWTTFSVMPRASTSASLQRQRAAPGSKERRPSRCSVRRNSLVKKGLPPDFANTRAVSGRTSSRDARSVSATIS
jgi:hypothetical protein